MSDKGTPYEFESAEQWYCQSYMVLTISLRHFREGNGRVARLVANLMALQAGKDMLDYAPIDRTKNTSGYNKYIHAIQTGFNGDYSEIEEIFYHLLVIKN